MKEKKFNEIPLTRFACTIADISGAEKPEKADGVRVNEILELVKNKTGKDTVDKLVIFNPDAIGCEFYNLYRKKIFAPLDCLTDLRIGFLTAVPPKTPVCFATMFTGADPSVHGINKYEKPVLKIDTLFDAWARAGKKVALVSKAGQSIPRIFADRKIDYFITDSDESSVNKAIELIKSDEYDVIEVYNQEYDDMLHVTYPRSYFCRRAAKRYVASYEKINDAVKKYYAGKTALITFSPDHGAHRIGGFLLGTHGKEIPSDMNIYHFFTVYGDKNE